MYAIPFLFLGAYDVYIYYVHKKNELSFTASLY